jgi:tetratricopeptide (TPR) repeat protein
MKFIDRNFRANQDISNRRFKNAIARTPYLHLVFFIIVFAAAILIFASPLLGFYYQLLGGQLLNSATPLEVKASAFTSCGPLTAVNPEARCTIQKALDFLQKSLNHSPHQSHTYLLLGRAYCLLGEPEKSIPYYHQFTKQREGNPIGNLELGFAYLAACQKEASNELLMKENLTSVVDCFEQDIDQLIEQHFQKAGINRIDFLQLADQALFTRDFETAARWYAAGINREQRKNPSYLFKYNLASAMIGTVLPFPLERTVEVYPLGERLIIEAEDFYWMREDPTWNLYIGDKLIDHPSTDRSVGVLWWSGSAIAVLESAEDETYRITLRVKDSDPGPIQLQLEHNFYAVEQFRLEEMNNSWKEISTTLQVPAGRHIIGIHFLEDNGDAVIDWVAFELQK